MVISAAEQVHMDMLCLLSAFVHTIPSVRTMSISIFYEGRLSGFKCCCVRVLLLLVFQQQFQSTIEVQPQPPQPYTKAIERNWLYAQPLS